jgi:3-deoxy-manno-octulosonate cytidylyltransferase (CMP-KDO synthetase)
MALKPLIVIPARLAAMRLPNKPLAMIHGKPMIVHVWERATQADVGPVIVACGDQEIVDAVKAHGGEAILTDPNLPRGSDRVKVAADIFDPSGSYNLIINVQGDLPTLDPVLVQDVLEPFKNPDVDIATLANLINDEGDLQDPNVVKVALTLDGKGPIGRALYFSRSPIPSGPGPHYHHIGLYAFKRDCLDRFASLPEDALEVSEKLEQLRALANGMRIDVKVVETETPFGVDTPADLEKARELLGI